MKRAFTAAVIVGLLVTRGLCQWQSEEEEQNDPWYTTDGELPEVDLEGIVANLSAQISWFKYIGEVTLDCAAKAHQEDTLVLAIEKLYDCLQASHKECASEYGKQGTACSSNFTSLKPCGNLRLGYGDGTHYDNRASCRWYLQVPDGFVMNLTFDQFFVEYSGPACIYDQVYVYDGHSVSNRSYGPLCGRLERFTIYGSADIMMVTALTDHSVSKYGFRAVYQVMDAGMGITNVGPTYHHGPSGHLNLSTTPWAFYETYFKGWYYYKWYISTDLSQNFKITLFYKADVNGSVVLHEGPTTANMIIKMLQFVRPNKSASVTGEPEIPTVEASSTGTIEASSTEAEPPRATTDGLIPEGYLTTTDKPNFAGYDHTASDNTSVFYNSTGSFLEDETFFGSSTFQYTDGYYTPTTPTWLRDDVTYPDVTSQEAVMTTMPDANMTTLKGQSGWPTRRPPWLTPPTPPPLEEEPLLPQPLQEVHVEATLSNQMLVVLKRALITDDTEFNLTYTSQPKGQQLNLVQDSQCIGQTTQRLSFESADIEIGLLKETAIMDGVPIQCFWNISAPEGAYVQLQVTSLHFNSPTSHDCKYEGLLIIDGSSFDPDHARYGPFCYDDPKGLFSHSSEGGVNNLTTSGRHLFVMYYSFVNYEMSPWPRGPFRALIRASLCRGYFQPCSPTPGLTFPTLNVTKRWETDSVLHVQAECDKASCCVLQQLPIYNKHQFNTCYLSVASSGQHYIATNRYDVGLAVPSKNDTIIHYACEQQDKQMKKKPGGSMITCLGTSAYVSYRSSSVWASGSFVITQSRAECGFYRPDVHTHNVFFPPCVTAEMPPTAGSYHYKITDPAYDNSTYYEISMDFAKVKCRRVPHCRDVKLSINSGRVTDDWMHIRSWPWRWFTWSHVSMTSSNWTQTISVIREPPSDITNHTCAEAYGEDCRLIIKAQKSSMPWSDYQLSGNYTCPSGFKSLGRSCYALVWPGDLTGPPQGYVPLEVNLSSDAAAEKCKIMTKGNVQTAHLADIGGAMEAWHLSQEVFFNWHREVFRHIPGMKVMHIGTNDKIRAGLYKSPHGKATSFSEWYMEGMLIRGPDHFRYPSADVDLASFRLPSVRSETIREGLDKLQPETDPSKRCTVKLINGNKMDSPWMKVPCGQPILGAVGLCEVEPEDLVKPQGAFGDLDVPDNLTTYIQSTSHGERLTTSEVQCALSMNMAGNICYALEVSIGVLNQDPASRCPKLFGERRRRKDESDPTGLAEMAFVDDAVLEKIKPLLLAWKQTKPNQGIRVSSTDPETGKEDQCYAIFYNTSATITSTYGESQTRWTSSVISHDHSWYLEALGDTSSASCRDERVTSFLCQTHPYPFINTCSPNIHVACSDGTCILTTLQCNGVADCLDGSDEESCSNPCWPVPQDVRSFHKEYCLRFCHPDNCTCDELYFQCEDGGCISISMHCDNQLDCADGSDESFCNVPGCDIGEHKCNTTYQCYRPTQRCNRILDCDDGSDEEDCDVAHLCKTNQPGYMYCGNTHTCVSTSLSDDNVMDCPPGPGLKSDETKLLSLAAAIKPDRDGLIKLEDYYKQQCVGRESSCSELFSKCYDRMKYTCVYQTHKITTMQTPCRLGQHLQDCQSFQCPSMFKCPNSYCVALSSVCDGTRDCENGEDEAKCERLYCPGMYKCQGDHRCLRQDKVCDDLVDCPLHRDDEQLCRMREAPCPHQQCLCRGHAVRCVGIGFTELTENRLPPKSVRAFIYRENKIMNLPRVINTYKHVYRLDMSSNQLTSIAMETFANMKCLVELYLHDNRIQSISNIYYDSLHRLKVLTLKGNQIRHLGDGAFFSLKSLQVLDLSKQLLQSMDRSYFQGMSSLRLLNLSHNELHSINAFALADKVKGRHQPLPNLEWVSTENNPLDKTPTDLFKYVPENATLQTDKFKFCCFTKHVKNCFPRADEFSSCEDLLANKMLRVFVWTSALMAFIGNSVVFIQRIRYEKETVPSLLIHHLAFADLLIAVYLIIVASSDVYYRGFFIHSAEEWQSSATCKFAGFLHLVGLEMSMFVVTLVTTDRVYALVPFCRSRGLKMVVCRTLLAVGWAGSVVMGPLPACNSGKAAAGRDHIDPMGRVLSYDDARVAYQRWIYQIRDRNQLDVLLSFFLIIPVLEFPYFGSETTYTTNGVCMLFNIIGGSEADACWEYSLSVVSVFNTICVVAMCIGYALTYAAIKNGIEVWTWQLADDMSDQEKESELLFRRNEVIIARRTMIITFTNFIIWLPIVTIGALAFIGVHVDKVTAAWIGLFVVPINSVLNPYLYTFSAGLWSGRIDDLLLNWKGDTTEMEGENLDEDPDVDRPVSEDGVDATLADTGESSVAPSSASRTEISSMAYPSISMKED